MPPQNPQQALAVAIRVARKRHGLSQVTFARRLGVSQQKLSHWENGRHLDAVISAWRLVEALNR